MTGDRVDLKQGVVYGSTGSRDLSCNVFTPPGRPTAAPGVLLIHGGAWRAGTPDFLRGYGFLIGREGYVCVAPEYRLTTEARWPAQIHDVKAALRWMRANHESLGLDPTRIAVMGNSAGGHLALMLGATQNDARFDGEGGSPGASTDLAAVINLYGITSVEPRRGLPAGSPDRPARARCRSRRIPGSEPGRLRGRALPAHAHPPEPGGHRRTALAEQAALRGAGEERRSGRAAHVRSRRAPPSTRRASSVARSRRSPWSSFRDTWVLAKPRRSNAHSPLGRTAVRARPRPDSHGPQEGGAPASSAPTRNGTRSPSPALTRRGLASPQHSPPPWGCKTPSDQSGRGFAVPQVKTCFSWFRRMGYVEENVFARVPLVKLPQKFQPPCSPDEVRVLLDAQDRDTLTAAATSR